MLKSKSYYYEQMKAQAAEQDIESEVISTLNYLVDVEEDFLGRKLTDYEFRDQCSQALSQHGIN